LFLFLVSVEFLENQEPTVRSNAVLTVKNTSAYSRTHAYLRSPDTPLRASARPCSKQAVQCCVRTHLQSLLNIRVAMIDRRSYARAHLSCCSSRPEAVYVFCFFAFFLFYLIFSLYLFIYYAYVYLFTCCF
jgi:hypothetical protein